MKVKNLKLKQFRNYNNLDINLSEGLNIFIGNNAQGKSNILESIFVLSLTKSYLNIKDNNLIKYDCDFFSVKGKICNDNLSYDLEVITTNDSKKLKVNNVEIKKYSDYVSRLKVLIFSPYNINFIKDGPNVRRKNINMVISQLNNSYIKLLQNYNAVLKKRNQFLKMVSNLNESNKIYFDNINDKFSDLAVEIMLKRLEYVNNVNKYLSNIYNEITGYDNLEFCYNPSINISDFDNIKEIFINKLNSLYERENMCGMTLIGPHRDDFSFLLNEKDLSLYGSQGQIRSAVLALKLSEVFLFQEVDDDYPVLLLDDIFSELDVEKRNRLVKYIRDDVQTIITTTDIHMIDESLVRKAKVFNVCNGEVVDDGKKVDNDE